MSVYDEPVAHTLTPEELERAEASLVYFGFPQGTTIHAGHAARSVWGIEFAAQRPGFQTWDWVELLDPGVLTP